MSQGKTYTFQRQGLENTIISVDRGQGKSGNFFQKPAYTLIKGESPPSPPLDGIMINLSEQAIVITKKRSTWVNMGLN